MCPMQLFILHSCFLEGQGDCPHLFSVPSGMAHVMSSAAPASLPCCGPDQCWTAPGLPSGCAEVGSRARFCKTLELGSHGSWGSQEASQVMQRGPLEDRGRQRKAEPEEWLVRPETMHFGGFMFTFSTWEAIFPSLVLWAPSLTPLLQIFPQGLSDLDLREECKLSAFAVYSSAL